MIGSCAACATVAYAALSLLARRYEEPQSLNADNPYFDRVSPGAREPSEYETIGKKAIDKALSFTGLIALAPVYSAVSLAIKLDDPGPVFFRQKRVGKDGHYFYLHKFRSMKMSTPHDVPTHMLENPEQYITRVGKLLRKTSLDELPQIWDIFRGKMSVIGPRPALWNQEDLVAERERYGANAIMPGLTGLAQISGRDELEIAEKARLDGEYAVKLREGGMKAFAQDLACFCGTILSVLRHDGVVEGGTGRIRSAEDAAK
ncbi:MAG: sugar transferase [Clostridium lundense]|jgi:O-antigen biosynthesis protein WbqP|nr:sugar transferase [Clostridium lundense]